MDLNGIDFFNIYHPKQTGGTSPYYEASVRRQRGAGIGGIFGAIGRKLLPFLSKHLEIYFLNFSKCKIF
jgi:hypothetical protein